MKYIRTKDGIFLKERNTPIGVAYLDCYCDKDGNITKINTSKEQYKEADIIEELCDNFLVEYTNGEHTMFHDFYHLQRHYNLYSQDYHRVAGRYGCIWVVGKGLIYVAKMNKDGELELL